MTIPVSHSHNLVVCPFCDFHLVYEFEWANLCRTQNLPAEVVDSEVILMAAASSIRYGF